MSWAFSCLKDSHVDNLPPANEENDLSFALANSCDPRVGNAISDLATATALWCQVSALAKSLEKIANLQIN